MIQRGATGEGDEVRKPQASPHGAPIGLLALRTVIVCGMLAGAAIGAIAAIGDKRQPTLTTSKHVVFRMLRVPQTIALHKHPAAAPVRQQMLDEDFSVGEAAATWARRIPDDVLQRDLSKADNGNQILRFGKMRIPRRLVETIVRAARETGADPALLMAIADKESSFSPDAKARTSSARGLFQFIDTTWFRAVREFGAQYGLAREAAEIKGPNDRPFVPDSRERAHILSLRDNPYLSALLAGEMLQHDSGEIARSIGRNLTEGEAYLTHFLGRQDASLFMEKVVEQPKLNAAKLLPKPAHANRRIFFAHGRAKALSVAAVHHKIEKMMATRVDRYTKVDKMASSGAFAE